MPSDSAETQPDRISCFRDCDGGPRVNAPVPEGAEAIAADRRELAAVSILLLLGAAARVVAVLAGPAMGDAERFWGLSDSLVQGRGYSRDGLPELDLAPGYPVFLAAVRTLVDSVALVLVIQMIAAVVTCAMIYRVCRDLAGPAFALVCLSWHALAPGVVLQAAMISSEGLTTFLLAALIAVSRWGNRLPCNDGLRPVAAGVLAAAATLTAPHAIFIGAAINLSMLVGAGKRGRHLMALAVGWLMCLVPWEIHCVRATGAPVLTILQIRGDAYRFDHESGYAVWVRSWYERASDFETAFFHLDRFEALPAEAFSSAEERAYLTGLVLGKGTNPEDLPESTDREFGVAARKRLGADRPLDRARRVLARTFYLWAEYSPGPTWLIAVRSGLFPSRQARGLVWYAGLASHISFQAFGLLALGAVVRRPDCFRLALFCGIAAYAVLSATFALCEARRNVTLYPSILVLAAGFTESAGRRLAPK